MIEKFWSERKNTIEKVKETRKMVRITSMQIRIYTEIKIRSEIRRMPTRSLYYQNPMKKIMMKAGIYAIF
jgi:hypothetical protein